MDMMERAGFACLLDVQIVQQPQHGSAMCVYTFASWVVSVVSALCNSSRHLVFIPYKPYKAIQ